MRAARAILMGKPSIVPFVFNNCLLFDGINDYLSFSAITLATSSGWSISFWHKGSAGVGFVGNSSDSGYIQLIADGRVIINTLGGLANYSFSNAAKNSAAWCHYVLTATSSQLRCYVNGIESSTGAISITSVSGPINQVGRRQAGSSYISGQIDEVAIWSGSALSGGQVISLYNSGLGDYATNYNNSTLVAYYKLDSVSGSGTAVDEKTTGAALLNNFNTATCWVAH